MKLITLEFVVSVVAKQDAPTRLGLFMSEIARKLGGLLVTQSVPETAPAEIPRLSVNTKDSVLNLCIDRLQFATKIPAHFQSNPSKAAEAVFQRANPIFEKYILEIASPATFSGVIATYHSAFNGHPPQLKIAEQLHDAILNVERYGLPMSSFLLQTGYQKGDYFANYTISGYESREVKIPTNLPPGNYQIEIGNSPIAESGIEIRVDVNNKPKKSKESPLLELQSSLDRCIEEGNGVSDHFLLNFASNMPIK